MLEFDAASKRFGSLPALDACSFRSTHRLPRAERGGEDKAMRAIFGLVEGGGVYARAADPARLIVIAVAVGGVTFALAGDYPAL